LTNDTENPAIKMRGFLLREIYYILYNVTMNNLCPLDGRYQRQTQALRSVMGEHAFAAARVRAEVAWLVELAALKLFALSAAERKLLSGLPNLTEKDLQILSQIETTGYKHIPATRHDVKALEYFLRLKLGKTSFKNRLHWLHFALTSDDINSVAYALLLSDSVEKVILPALERIRKNLAQLAKKEARSLLLARTHGQPAVPTSFGKEIRVFDARLLRQIRELKTRQISCKFSGAVGNYNAHYAAFPSVNWPRAARELVGALNKNRKIKLFLSPVSTQIDNRDSYAELFDNLRRINVILLGLCRDLWQYISAGLVRQKVVAGEIGSSTMPQKVNPIDFENGEGNLQLANALLNAMSEKLPLSRLQRDLSDSTVLRNMGVAFGYGVVAYDSILKGLCKIAFDRSAALAELSAHPEVVAEGLQTLLRAHGVSDAYERLKTFTRGQKITAEILTDFIEQLPVSAALKKRFKNLTLSSYVGIATRLAEGKYD